MSDFGQQLFDMCNLMNKVNAAAIRPIGPAKFIGQTDLAASPKRDSFDDLPIPVTLTRAEATQLLALALQDQLADRTGSVSRQLSCSAVRKLDAALDGAWGGK